MKDLFEQIREDFLEDSRQDTIQEIKMILNSPEAQESLKKINQLFIQNDLPPVGDPSEIAKNVKLDQNGDIILPLTEDQRRFLFADNLYGKDILGFKYREI